MAAPHSSMSHETTPPSGVMVRNLTEEAQILAAQAASSAMGWGALPVRGPSSTTTAAAAAADAAPEEAAPAAYLAAFTHHSASLQQNGTPLHASFVSHAPASILCPECGTRMPPNPSNLCAKCIRNRVDITEGIQKACTVLWCKQCDRYHSPPRAWIHAELESKELLTFLVKKVKGIKGKVKLTDASFVWTEPHSRRIKIKLTVQKEVLNGGTILQQSFLVEFVVEPHMCMECARITANPEQWIGCVQARQRAEHRRTFLFLEQLILKHAADENVIGVRKKADGLDFYFSHRSHSLKFVDFLGSVVPIRHRADRQLVSQDFSDNTFRYKYTFFTELVPVCKDDLVCLPRKLSNKAHGGIGPVLLCTRVGTAITLTDPNTNRYIQLDGDAYWRNPLKPLASQRTLTTYVVLDIELVGARGGGPDWDDAASVRSMRSAGAGASTAGRTSVGSHISRFQLADVTVARSADLGANDSTLRCRTHLGAVLNVGDTVLGYDLQRLNITDDDFVEHAQRDKDAIPDCVLVRKSYQEKRKARRERRAAAAARRAGGTGAAASAMATENVSFPARPSPLGQSFADTGAYRPWTLRTLEMEEDDEEGGGGGGRGKRGKRSAKLARENEDRDLTDRERFFQELEEDADMRGRVALYRKPQPQGKSFDLLRDDDAGNGDGDGDSEDDDVPEVPLEELMTALSLDEQRKRRLHGGSSIEEMAEDEEDDDDEVQGDDDEEEAANLDDPEVRASHTRRAIMLGAGVKRGKRS